MDDRALIEFMGILEKLKCNTRHSWTSSGRHESVAEHSWRLSVLSLLTGDRFPGVDMGKVLIMCLIHDFGEAVMGDIPSFEKTEEDDDAEAKAVDDLLNKLPDKLRDEFKAMFSEMREMKTEEAKAWRALDMLEAVFQHNEADVSTWIELERELNLTYGNKEVGNFQTLASLRRMLRSDSEDKLENE